LQLAVTGRIFPPFLFYVFASVVRTGFDRGPPFLRCGNVVYARRFFFFTPSSNVRAPRPFFLLPRFSPLSFFGVQTSYFALCPHLRWHEVTADQVPFSLFLSSPLRGPLAQLYGFRSIAFCFHGLDLPRVFGRPLLSPSPSFKIFFSSG